MVIEESSNYKKDYRKIIINKHMIREQERINNIKNIILKEATFDLSLLYISSSNKLILPSTGSLSWTIVSSFFSSSWMFEGESSVFISGFNSA